MCTDCFFVFFSSVITLSCLLFYKKMGQHRKHSISKQEKKIKKGKGLDVKHAAYPNRLHEGQ